MNETTLIGIAGAIAVAVLALLGLGGRRVADRIRSRSADSRYRQDDTRFTRLYSDAQSGTDSLSELASSDPSDENAISEIGSQLASWADDVEDGSGSNDKGSGDT